jgi:hypothetical protein
VWQCVADSGDCCSELLRMEMGDDPTGLVGWLGYGSLRAKRQMATRLKDWAKGR